MLLLKKSGIWLAIVKTANVNHQIRLLFKTLENTQIRLTFQIFLGNS